MKEDSLRVIELSCNGLLLCLSERGCRRQIDYCQLISGKARLSKYVKSREREPICHVYASISSQFEDVALWRV